MHDRSTKVHKVLGVINTTNYVNYKIPTSVVLYISVMALLLCRLQQLCWNMPVRSANVGICAI